LVPIEKALDLVHQPSGYVSDYLKKAGFEYMGLDPAKGDKYDAAYAWTYHYNAQYHAAENWIWTLRPSSSGKISDTVEVIKEFLNKDEYERIPKVLESQNFNKENSSPNQDGEIETMFFRKPYVVDLSFYYRKNLNGEKSETYFLTVSRFF
jgi:hypothetical protein